MLKFFRPVVRAIFAALIFIVALFFIPFLFKFLKEMRKIEMGLPTAWSTRREIENILRERHTKTLEKWARNWFITSRRLIPDDARRALMNEIASGLPSAMRQEFLFAATLDGFLNSLFANRKIHQRNIVVANPYFFPNKASIPIELLKRKDREAEEVL